MQCDRIHRKRVLMDRPTGICSSFGFGSGKAIGNFQNLYKHFARNLSEKLILGRRNDDGRVPYRAVPVSIAYSLHYFGTLYFAVDTSVCAPDFMDWYGFSFSVEPLSMVALPHHCKYHNKVTSSTSTCITFHIVVGVEVFIGLVQTPAPDIYLLNPNLCASAWVCFCILFSFFAFMFLAEITVILLMQPCECPQTFCYRSRKENTYLSIVYFANLWRYLSTRLACIKLKC